MYHTAGREAGVSNCTDCILGTRKIPTYFVNTSRDKETRRPRDSSEVRQGTPHEMARRGEGCHRLWL